MCLFQCWFVYFFFFFFKQKTAYEMRISDWSSDVCSSDLPERDRYRLPKTFRKTDGQVEKSWSGQASAASDAGNAGIGSCSPVGAGGATGCNRQMMRTAKQQRKQERAEEEVMAAEMQNA